MKPWLWWGLQLVTELNAQVIYMIPSTRHLPHFSKTIELVSISAVVVACVTSLFI